MSPGLSKRLVVPQRLVSCSCWPQQDLEQRSRSRRIDRQLQRDKQLARRQVKLLLLGTGESGKSTLLKQMRIIHGVSFDADTLDQYRRVVYENTVRGARVLIDALHKLGISWGAESGRQSAGRLMSLEVAEAVESGVFCDLAPCLRQLWTDAGIQLAFSRRHEYQLAGSVGYFLDSVDRTGRRDYVPSNQDVLMARKASKGATEFTININGVPFMFVDVGGQRSQRQKWFTCFENVTSILFLVSSCEFDEVLLEDRQTNRLEESCNVFDTIVNNYIFSSTSVIVFFNKTDLLSEKLRRPSVDISLFYPDFKGDPHCLQDVQKFLLHKFMALRRRVSSPARAPLHCAANSNNNGQVFECQPLFHHYTTAIDTENITVVFHAVKDTILQRNLQCLLLQ